MGSSSTITVDAFRAYPDLFFNPVFASQQNMGVVGLEEVLKNVIATQYLEVITSQYGPFIQVQQVYGFL